MKKTLSVVSGITAVGKTTFSEIMQDSFVDRGISVAVANEYSHILQWADLEKAKPWLYPVEGSPDIRPEGYVHMSRHVSETLGDEISQLFDEGVEIVMFETARGVGDPVVGYGEFIEGVTRHLFSNGLEFQVINIELTAPIDQVRRRMEERYASDPEKAPPPQVLDKYLGDNGLPLRSSLEDLAAISLGMPLVMNEGIQNLNGRELLEGIVSEILLPKVLQCIDGSQNYSLEGGNLVSGKERL